MHPATERQYFWMIDGQSKELDYTTLRAFDAVIKNTALPGCSNVLSLTSQIYASVIRSV